MRRLINATRTFEALGMPDPKGVSPNMMSCNDIAMRTSAIWRKIDDNTKVKFASIQVPLADGKVTPPRAEDEFDPDVDRLGGARWLALASERLKRDVVKLERDLMGRGGMFGTRDRKTPPPKAPESPEAARRKRRDRGAVER